jgi:ABC-type uncharacterized transport system substrate-binding protein
MAGRPGYDILVDDDGGAAMPGLHSAAVHAILIRMSKHSVLAVLAVLTGTLTLAGPAAAHPHVWVSIKAELVYEPDGTIRGVRHIWSFDDMFSAFAVQGIESEKRGEYSRAQLAPLAKTNVESLKEFEYFTVAKANGKRIDFVDPTADYYLEYKDATLTLYFNLPFKAPVKAQSLDIEVYDPSYFVEFVLAEKNPVSLVGAPAGCKLTVVPPGQMDAALSQKLFQMAPDQKLDPSQQLGAQFANRILVKCQ